MISQSQHLKLQQKLSPQQILLMRLLQVPAIALEQTIKEEVEKNPLLEDSSDSDADSTETAESGEVDYDAHDESSEMENDFKDFDFEDYMKDEEPSYRERMEYDKNEEHDDIPFASEITFQDRLIEQLNLKQITEKQYFIGVEIIGNIDESGYISRSINAIMTDLDFTQNIEATYEEVESVLKIIQSLEPIGIGARNLQECLSLQLHHLEEESKYKEWAIIIIDKYFETFTKKHYDKIMKKLNISEFDLSIVLDIILKLNPKPGSELIQNSQENRYIIPDFFVTQIDGKLSFTLNNKNLPSLKISKHYLNILKEITTSKVIKKEQKETVSFIKEKADSAKWFIDAIKQRHNTLEKTMDVIIDYQYKYFLTGNKNDLRPMRLKEIAAVTHFDISTISRVINQKYVQTDFGTFLLKELFSKSFTTEDGEDVATEAIKHIMIECIENEDKSNPLTDEELKELLNNKGFPLARRTVAKYRETLKIPIGRLRKELKIK